RLVGQGPAGRRPAARAARGGRARVVGGGRGDGASEGGRSGGTHRRQCQDPPHRGMGAAGPHRTVARRRPRLVPSTQSASHLLRSLGTWWLEFRGGWRGVQGSSSPTKRSGADQAANPLAKRCSPRQGRTGSWG